MSIHRPPILSHCLTPPPGFPPPDRSSPPRLSAATWRMFARSAALRSPRKSLSFSARSYSFAGVPRERPVNPKKLIIRGFEFVSRQSLIFYDMGVSRKGEVSASEEKHSFQTRVASGFCPRGYTCLVEAIVSSTDVEDEVSVVEEVEELLAEIRKEREFQLRRKVVADREMGIRKYNVLRRRQAKIECEAWEQAVKEYKELIEDMCAQKLAPNLPYMKSLFLGWFEPLRNRIVEEQELFRAGKKKTAHLAYFDQLPADMMAVITMHKLVALLMTGEEPGVARVVQAACTIGDAIEQEIRIHHFLEKTKRRRRERNHKTGGGSLNELSEEQEKLSLKVSNLLKKHNLPAVKQLVKGQDGLKPWSQEVKAKVGSCLIELLIQNAYIQLPSNQLAEDPPDIRPAFSHTFKTVTKDTKNSSRRYGVIECDQAVLKGLERTRHMIIPYMPMLVPPIKWTAYDRGAYLFLTSTVMRTRGSKQQREAVKRAPQGQLKSVFEALDILGATRWRVNRRVLSVVDRIWNSGGRLAGLVDRSDVSLPNKPETEDDLLIKKWKWRVKAVQKENMERHSQRCDIELKLAVARKMRDEEGFYYPHNLDFRGRAYPMHSYLNHLGSDLCRGILEFAEGRPLGKSGLHWLKIHVANLFAGGVDKLSLEARVAFTENHLDDIFDSADRPLEGKKWWLNAEDPFQCLAVCINLTEALRSTSPETFLSHVPVHQDGSCNGLQHYAALGRDKLGAAAVNLVAGEKPEDVYSGIAARVLGMMQRDAQKDPEVFPYAVHARTLVNQVDRKLVKQTVMTSVYGVTYIGARDQIKRRLKERGAILDDTEIFGASCYAAKVTLTALGEMFEAARSIMCWLGECAKIIASQNQPVRWTTPVGLPVVQPYRRVGRHLVKTSLQVLSLQRETDKVLVQRQRTAFPPNFVHSLDGSHMMTTAVACKKAGLTFAGVHDSYWTHACNVDEMNRILREKFVELHETPILENIRGCSNEITPPVSSVIHWDYILADTVNMCISSEMNITADGFQINTFSEKVEQGSFSKAEESEEEAKTTFLNLLVLTGREAEGILVPCP